MKRFPIVGGMLLIPALALLFAIGCTPGDKGATKTAAEGETAKTEIGKKDKKAGAKADITTELAATVSGVVKFNGEPPAPKVNPKIAEHKDAMNKMCGGPSDQLEQTWLVSKDGGVANVVISLTPPSGKKFKITDKLKEESKHDVHLDQPYCNFVPHVVAIWPDVQTLVAKNSAKVPHNVKIERGALLGPYNATVSPGETKDPDLKGAKGIIDATCDIHGWMSAKIAVFNNPYFAVTNDKGEFTIKNVPIDVELGVNMWHESTNKTVEVQKITPKKGDNELKLAIGK